MKKIVSILLSVIMMLTTMASMPVFAEDTTAVNLVVNGDFEQDAVADSTAITGWTNAANAKVCYKSGNGGNVADLPANAQLRQVIPISSWVVSGGNHGYIFSADMNYNMGGYPAFKVTATFEDGTAASQMVAVKKPGEEITDPKSQLAATLWQWNKLEYDISWLTQSKLSKLVSITIDLLGQGAGCQYDNVVIVQKEAPVIDDNTGSNENSGLIEGYEGKIISTNGDFESITSENLLAKGWALDKGTLVTGASDAYAGNAYIKVAAGGSVSFTAANMPETGYMLRGYYKHMTDGNKTANSQIFMQQVGIASSNYNSALAYTNTWTKFGMILNAAQMNGGTGSIRFSVNNGTGCSTLCLDSLELIRLDDYDKRNIVQNPGFAVNDVDTDSTLQHHYASWFNNGTARLLANGRADGSAIRVDSGTIYTWAALPTANTTGKKYEFSAWVKWANGGKAGVTAPVVGIESYAGNPRVYAKDYSLTAATGLTSSDWCNVKFILDAESTPTNLTTFRVFLKPAAGGILWDDICIKPVETALDIMDSAATKIKRSVARENSVVYTARAQYVGAADGTLSITAYSINAAGAIAVLSEKSVTIKADGRTTLCTLDAVNTNSINATIVKAQLKDASGNVVATKEINSSVETGAVITNDFEDLTTGAPANATEWVGAGVDTSNAYRGSRALVLSGSNSRAYFEYDGLLPGNEYKATIKYKGSITSGDGLVIRRFDWADTGEAPVYTKSYESGISLPTSEWQTLEYTFTHYEGSKIRLGPWLKNSTGTVYIDDLIITATGNANAARVVTDQVFYYSDLSGNGKATVYLDPRFAGMDCTADIKLMDGKTVLKEAKNIAFANGKAEFEYDLTLLSVLKKEYTVEATVKAAEGYIILGTYTQKIYKYDRPSTISKDGTFTDINGKKINPTFMYHIPYEDFASAASAGINVVQYVAPSDVNECLAQLDEMYEMGVYAGVVCYWGMSPAGNAVNHDKVKAFIEKIKHHPAIFCYMVMDEPFLNNSNAYEDLRKSYIMLRNADPARPTYICEGFPAYMTEVAKYCDIMAPDPYPGYVRGDMATFVSDMVGYAHKYVNYQKPIITILQAFTQSGVKPTALQLHSMMYQSLMAGGNAVGFYTWEPDNADVDQVIDEGIYWPMLQTFYAKEKNVVYDYYAYGNGKAFNQNKGTGNVWYEGFTDMGKENLYMVIQNRSSSSSTTATIPLVSQDGKVKISNYTVEILGYGADTATIKNKVAGSFDITLAPCQAVLCKIITEDIVNITEGQNLIVNGGFESVSNNSPANWNGFRTWTNGSKISLVNAASEPGNVYSGNYAVKYSTKNGDNPYIAQTVNGILARGKYKFSFWYKGTTTGNGFSIKFEQYGTGGSGEQYSGNFTTSQDWKYAEYEFYAKDGVNSFSVMPRTYTEGTEIYIDNVRLMLVGGPIQFKMETDWIFYYENYDAATVTLTMDEFYADTGYTVDVKISDGNTTYTEATGLKMTNRQLVYKADITSLAKKTEYILSATVKNSDGIVVETLTQPIYRIDRPTSIDENGIYYVDGEPFEPVIAYHFDMNDYEDAKKAGVNVIQYVVSASTKEARLAELDALQQKGLKAAVVCYWGMKPAGHETNEAGIKQLVSDIKDHPAVFCYMVMDEPFSHANEFGGVEAMEAYLRNSYKIIRTIDDKHPVFLCEDNKSRYSVSAKYVDCLGIDPYPGTNDFSRYVADMAEAAVAGARGEKPVYAIVQSMSWKGITPTGDMLRAQLYQAMMAGAKGYGYYPWVPDNEELDTDLNEGRYWDTILSFHQKAQPKLMEYFGRGEGKRFNVSHTDNLWYESWVDGNDIYMAVASRLTGGQTVTIPLTSSNGKITLSSYNMSVVNGGDMSAVTKKAGSFTVNLSGYQTVLYKITPTDAPDLSQAGNIAPNSGFESLTNGKLDNWGFGAAGGVTAPTQAQALKTDASGNKYISLTIGTSRVETEVDTEAGKSYIIRFDYKSTEDRAALVTVDAVPGYRQVGIWLPSTNGAWVTEQVMIELTDAEENIFPRLRNMSGKSEVMFDNVYITEAQTGALLRIVDENGASLKEIENKTGAAYTAKANYVGDDKGAMLYLASYTKDADGVLRLAGVNGAVVSRDGIQSRAQLTGVNTVAGTTVVKAFILGTQNNVIIDKIVE